MNYFDVFSSNSLAGTGNQSCFLSDGEIHVGRVFYKVFTGGKYQYSFLFSNIIDSRFTEITHTNCVCDDWEIVSLKVAVTSDCNPEVPEVRFCSVNLDGKNVYELPTGLFCSETVELEANKDDYICLEISFKGSQIPCHPEIRIESFVKENEDWKKNVNMPVAHMIGCDRKVKKKVAFLGDSITQGIGVEPNSYKHWCALLADLLGNENAFWNLGIGFGRALDAATDGAWLAKAKQNDVVFVCFGVNDLLSGEETIGIQRSLNKIARILCENGSKVIIQSVPPFDYSEDIRYSWRKVNQYIKESLLEYIVGYFDNVPVLCGMEEHLAQYGLHPNEDGCEKWAEALYEYLMDTNLF